MKTFFAILVLLPIMSFADTYLSYDGNLRKEADAAVIANLKRKGWIDAPKPSYNAATQQPPEWKNGAWVVRNLTQAELDAATQAAADKAERQQIKAMMANLKAGTGTNGERITRIEKALHRLLKDTLR